MKLPKSKSKAKVYKYIVKPHLGGKRRFKTRLKTFRRR